MLPIPSSHGWDPDLPRNYIDVRRGFVLSDTLREMVKPTFDVTKLIQVNVYNIYNLLIIIILKVHFVREEAVDLGGPARDYWGLIARNISNDYCCGKEGNLFFDVNTPALQVKMSNSIILSTFFSARS